ncbi:MAG: sigma-54-dependent Fis family transcriptional regulator [Brevinematales bacterium]|nr:sigma-54-dependent Fis family transcriptional regulator [Brevinematales bacterium]
MQLIKGLENFIEEPQQDKLQYIEEMKQFGIIGSSDSIIQSFLRAKKAAKSNANILIQGDSGTGKELFAIATHYLGIRKDGPLVKLNCAAIPETLLESELFGYEKGAFTGAGRQKIGKFENANKGTIFLDEIGEMSLALQAKILRVIEDKIVTRVGGLEAINIDVRIISATNRDLWQEVRKTKFREDLYYRINVIFLHLPPLRERREDIPLLVDFFIKRYVELEGVHISQIDEDVVKLLISFNWPGNVRQLENVIHHAMIMTDDERISIDDIPDNIFSSSSTSENINNLTGYIKKDNVIITDLDLDEMEKTQILKALEKAHWKMSKAAELLGIHRNTLTQKMKKYKLK